MNRALLLFFLLAFGINVTAGGQTQLSQEEKAKLAKQVKTLFRNKCAKCHGPVGVRETEKPKGEMDYILDLEKLASNPEIVVRGDPDESKLFNMVQDEIMPDENSEDPLPEDEKKLIHDWILAGAPTEEGKRPAVKYHCPATEKFALGQVYSPEQLAQNQFSTFLEELPEGAFVSRCSFSSADGKETCNRYKVDRIEFDQDLNIKKYYVFSAQFNFQLFSDLASLTDNGRGGVQYGKCEFISQ